VYFCVCTKRNAPLHPRTPVPTKKFTKFLHKHGGPLASPTMLNKYGTGGRATTHHDAYALVLAWYGTGWSGPQTGVYIEANICSVREAKGRDHNYCPAYVQGHTHLRAYKRLCGACVLLIMRYTHCADIPLRPRIQDVYIDTFSAWVDRLHNATCLTATAKYTYTTQTSRGKSNEKFFIS